MKGDTYQIANFAMAKYPITNAQFQKFLDDPAGYANAQWWEYSPQASQWHKDHPNPRPTAFEGTDLPRTRVSWFESIAFCNWLTAQLKDWARIQPEHTDDTHTLHIGYVRLPTEQEWQRAAVGDTSWRYPWGDQLNALHANYGNQISHPTAVGSYPDGQSPYQVMDMVGNVWEWCLTAWETDSIDMGGYAHRVIKGGAWNVSHPDYLRAIDRGGNSPRGRLNDCGFRCVWISQ